MPAPEALALFDAACALDKPVLVPARVDVAALRGRTGGDVPPLLRDLAGGGRPRRDRANTAGDGGSQGLVARLAALPADEAQAAVLDWVRDQVAVVLGHPSGAAVNVDQAFTQLGFDSLTSVELCNRLATSTGLRLPTTLVFSYPTPRELSEHLHGLLRPAADTGTDADGDEDARIRDALRNVSVDSLRAAGLLDLVLACADTPHPADDGTPAADAGVDELTDLDLEALVDLALDEKR
ncbi:beta-ketoacyl reductase [Streptomyces griseoincarnatus]